jgi:nucleoside-diphosphate-sugar epimerase
VTEKIYRVAVLGGSRFIGYAIVEALLEKGYRVTTINRGVTPVNYSGPVERIIADREDSSAYSQALAGIDVECVVDVMAYTANETQAVLDAFLNRLKRFIHISTMSVYKWPFSCPVSEDAPLETDPLNSYGFNKAACERLIISEPEDHFPWTILRLPPIFGPCDTLSREAYFYRQILEEKVITIPYRPFLCQNLFVVDAARAVCSLIENPKAIGRVFNAGGEPFILEDYVNILAGLMSREPRMIRAEERVLKRSGANPRRIPYFFEEDLVLDTKRIQNEIGFETVWDMEQALFATLEGFSDSSGPQETGWWGLPWDRIAQSSREEKLCPEARIFPVS